MEKIVGQTKDVGFQFGIRRTFSIPFEDAWGFLFSKNGIKIWLGELAEDLEVNKPCITKEGTEILVRIFKPNSHLRMSWKKKNWNNTATLQMRVIKNTEKTTISFHLEKLLNSEQRLEMKSHWNGVMDKLAREIEPWNS